MRSPNISRGVAKNPTKFQGRELWRIVNRLKLSIVAKLSISDISVGPSPDSDLLKGMIWSLVCFHLVLLLYEELKLNGKIPNLKINYYASNCLIFWFVVKKNEFSWFFLSQHILNRNISMCGQFGVKENNVISTNPFVLLATRFAYFSVHILSMQFLSFVSYYFLKLALMIFEENMLVREKLFYI